MQVAVDRDADKTHAIVEAEKMFCGFEPELAIEALDQLDDLDLKADKSVGEVHIQVIDLALMGPACLHMVVVHAFKRPTISS